jgi:hypothetical protein
LSSRLGAPSQAAGAGRPRQHPKITMRRAIAQRLDVVEFADTTRERYGDLIRLYILPASGGISAPHRRRRHGSPRPAQARWPY